jgi:hypothetical protein
LRVRVALLLSVALVLGNASVGAAGHNDDDHSDNMKLIGSVELNGATDVEFTKDGYAVVAVNGSGEFA